MKTSSAPIHDTNVPRHIRIRSRRSAPLDRDECLNLIDKYGRQVRSWRLWASYHAENGKLEEAYSIWDEAKAEIPQGLSKIFLGKAKMAYLYGDNDKALQVIESEYIYNDHLKMNDRLNETERKTFFQIIAVYQAASGKTTPEIRQLCGHFVSADGKNTIYTNYKTLKAEIRDLGL